MKKKNKLIHKVSAFVCALVVLLSSFSFGECFSASESRYSTIASIYEEYTGKTFDFVLYDEYSYVVWLNKYNEVCMYGFVEEEGIYLTTFTNYSEFDGRSLNVIDLPYWKGTDTSSRISWHNVYSNTLNTISSKLQLSNIRDTPEPIILYSDVNCYYDNGKGGTNRDVYLDNIFYESDASGPSYNGGLGYLKNVRVNHVFEEVPLGENVNEKWVSRWYFDTLSTSGIDLSSGNYSVNYYEERWIVKGYKEDDVVEKSDRYLLGTYNARDGYFTTNSQHIDEFLQAQGYEEPNFFDLWFNKFVTTHYYLQIVDDVNNEVGGYVHIYLTDDNGNFGVELIGESIDKDGNIDDNGFNGFIDENKTTSDDVEDGFNELENNNEQTIEEWLESLQDDYGDIQDGVDGTDGLINALTYFGQEVGSFASALGVFLGAYPFWVMLGVGVCVCLLFIAILFKLF